MEFIRSALMVGKRIKLVCARCLIMLLVFVLVGCGGAPQPAFDESYPIEMPPTVTDSRLMTPTPTAMPTPVPVTLFVADTVPMDILAWDRLPKTQRSNGQLWFGPAVDAPAGEAMATATWVYALAAPFPTLVDDIPFSDLHRPTGWETLREAWSQFPGCMSRKPWRKRLQSLGCPR
jgi:hypothetical protein